MSEQKYLFEEAIALVKQGKTMKSVNWDNAFIFMVPGSNFTVSRAPLLGIYPEGTPITYRSHIDIKNEDNSIMPWVPQQSDMFSLYVEVSK